MPTDGEIIAEAERPSNLPAGDHTATDAEPKGQFLADPFHAGRAADEGIVIGQLVFDGDFARQHAGVIDRTLFTDPAWRAVFDTVNGDLSRNGQVDPARIRRTLEAADPDHTEALLADLVAYAQFGRLSAECALHRLIERRGCCQLADLCKTISDQVGTGSMDHEKARLLLQDTVNNGIHVADQTSTTLATGLTDPAELTAHTVPTGLKWFDRCMAAGALERGELVGFAAPPKVGKSALMLQLTLSALQHDSDLEAVWCLGEMTLRQLQTRAWAVLSGETFGILRRPDEELSPRQREAKKHGGETIRSIGQRLHIVAAPFTPAAIEQAVLDHDAALVVVDYLQRLRPDRPRDTIREAIDECMGELVRIAKQRSVAMLLISNLPKSASDHADMLTVFKESSTIGYDLDVGYVGKLPGGDEGDEPADKVQIEWRCLGNRNGPPRSFTTCFDRPTQTFAEVIG